jgi:hypothetical protein
VSDETGTFDRVYAVLGQVDVRVVIVEGGDEKGGVSKKKQEQLQPG